MGRGQEPYVVKAPDPVRAGLLNHARFWQLAWCKRFRETPLLERFKDACIHHPIARRVSARGAIGTAAGLTRRVRRPAVLTLNIKTL